MKSDIYNWDAENQTILPKEGAIYRREEPPRKLYCIIGFLCLTSLGGIAVALWLYIQYVA